MCYWERSILERDPEPQSKIVDLTKTGLKGLPFAA